MAPLSVALPWYHFDVTLRNKNDNDMLFFRDTLTGGYFGNFSPKERCLAVFVVRKFRLFSFFPYSWFLLQAVLLNSFLDKSIPRSEMVSLTIWQLLSLVLYYCFQISFSKALRQNQSVPQKVKKTTEKKTHLLALAAVLIHLQCVPRIGYRIRLLSHNFALSIILVLLSYMVHPAVKILMQK